MSGAARTTSAPLPDLGTREGLLVFQLMAAQEYLEEHHELGCRYEAAGGTCSCDVDELWWTIVQELEGLGVEP